MFWVFSPLVCGFQFIYFNAFSFCRHSVSSVIISNLPVAWSVIMLSKNSAISFLSNSALSTLETPAGDSDRPVVYFVLLHCQISLFLSLHSLPVSLSLRLSRISAISLMNRVASSTLVSTVAVFSCHILFPSFY